MSKLPKTQCDPDTTWATVKSRVGGEKGDGKDRRGERRSKQDHDGSGNGARSFSRKNTYVIGRAPILMRRSTAEYKNSISSQAGNGDVA